MGVSCLAAACGTAVVLAALPLPGLGGAVLGDRFPVVALLAGRLALPLPLAGRRRLSVGGTGHEGTRDDQRRE